jgi:dolichol-phosphate mannosyltransferase
MLWLVIPAYNEEASLPRLFPKLKEALEGRGEPFRIVVVDDGSTDATPGILGDLAKQLPLDVITHRINRGLGETERDGFEFIAARARPEDRIVRLEADDTHEPRYVGALLARLDEGYDVVITSRFQAGGGQQGLSAYRAFVSRGANLFMSLLYRVPGVREYSCGYRAYRAQVIQDAVRVFGNDFIQLRGLGFTSTLEMLVKLHLLGCRFAEVPFVLRYDQKASASKMIGSVTTLGYLIMTVLYYWPFGGWLSQYQGLRRLYRRSPSEAVARYNGPSLPRRTASRVSL